MNEVEKKIKEIEFLKNSINELSPLIENYSKEEKVIKNLSLLNPLKYDLKIKRNQVKNKMEKIE